LLVAVLAKDLVGKSSQTTLESSHRFFIKIECLCNRPKDLLSSQVLGLSLKSDTSLIEGFPYLCSDISYLIDDS
jgi:hypothetical protein